MHTVIETPTFIRHAADARVPADELISMIDQIANNPTIGDLIPGTGGARKIRFAGRGKGKSGGYRLITYFAGDDVPVVLLALLSKGQRANISQAEKNALRAELSGFADDYRASMRARVANIRRK